VAEEEAIVEGGFAHHLVSTLLGSRARVELTSSRCPVPFYPFHGTFLLRDEGVELLAEVVAARAQAPAVYRACLAMLRCERRPRAPSSQLPPFACA
jgi:hypothetical protein